MKIGLIGYGKMGKVVEVLAEEMGHEIVACLNSGSPDFSSLNAADICIDFSTPDAVLGNAKEVIALKKNLVIGTTGWEQHLREVVSLAEKERVGILFAPNFSIGMYRYKQLLKSAGELLHSFDVAGIEMHHNQKKDRPSGSAKVLSTLLQRPLEFSSVRCGDLIGTHQVIFNSGDDTIELTHRAGSRKCFSKGAIEAAQWLLGKIGYYTFEDFMEEKVCDLKV